jgi:hypothetical protein
VVFCSDVFIPRDETDPTEIASDSYKKDVQCISYLLVV